MSTVCASIPSERGKFRFISVVANYTNGNRPDDGARVGQFEFQCGNDGTWTNNVLNGVFATIPSHAGFNTTLRKDCAVCIAPSHTSLSLIRNGRNYDPVTHCISKLNGYFVTSIYVTRPIWQQNHFPVLFITLLNFLIAF